MMEIERLVVPDVYERGIGVEQPGWLEREGYPDRRLLSYRCLANECAVELTLEVVPQKGKR